MKTQELHQQVKKAFSEGIAFLLQMILAAWRTQFGCALDIVTR